MYDIVLDLLHKELVICHSGVRFFFFMVVQHQSKTQRNNNDTSSLPDVPLSHVAITGRLISISLLPFILVCSHAVFAKIHYQECRSSLQALFMWENARFCHLLGGGLQLVEKAMWCYLIAIAKDVRFVIAWIFNEFVPACPSSKTPKPDVMSADSISRAKKE
jgi:hypothetical protein